MLKRRRLLPFLTIFLFSIPVIAFCQGYGVSWNAFTCGGGIRESTNYRLADAIGQVEAKKSSSQNYNVVLVPYLPVLGVGPTARITLFPSSPVGLGKVEITLITFEEVEGIPTLSFTPQGKSPITVYLSGSDTTFTGEIEITYLTGDGRAQFSYLAKEKDSGETGTKITEGETFEIITIKTANSLIPVNNLFHPLKGEHTTIRYRLDNTTHVSLKIYNLAGELIKTLVDVNQSAGPHEINWYGKNKDGDLVASGVYILRIEAGGFTDTKKMVVIK